MSDKKKKSQPGAPIESFPLPTEGVSFTAILRNGAPAIVSTVGDWVTTKDKELCGEVTNDWVFSGLAFIRGRWVPLMWDAVGNETGDNPIGNPNLDIIVPNHLANVAAQLLNARYEKEDTEGEEWKK